MQCPGTPRSKSSGSFTFIGGATASGENIPCCIQFQSDAQHIEDAAISYSWIDGLPIASGKFGHEEVKDFLATWGVNEKGSMNACALYEHTKAANL
eukprot:9205938-Ditylum_brightwellii.AAC.1